MAVARGQLPLQLGADQGQVDGVAAFLKKGGGGRKKSTREVDPKRVDPFQRIPEGSRTHQGAGEAVEGPPGLVAEQLEQDVLTLL